MMNTGKNQNIKKNMAARLAFAVAVALAGMWCILATAAVYAATPVSKVPIVCYAKTTGRCATWSSVNGSRSGYISGASDQCVIRETYENGWCLVEYPTARGKKTAYSWMEFFFCNTEFSPKEVTAGEQKPVFWRADCKTSQKLGTVYSNDTIIVIGTSGNATQILYPAPSSGGYKLGWVKGSIGVAQGTAKPVADGMYKLVSALSSKYVWDIDSASTANGARLQLYEDNNSNAQKFNITYNSDGYYTITNVHSGKAIDCAGNSSANGTRIQQYSPNNTPAQRWKLVAAGDGRFSIVCKSNGKAIDVAGGIVSNRRSIQLYQRNHSAAQQFRLVGTTKNTAVTNNNSVPSTGYANPVCHSSARWSSGKEQGKYQHDIQGIPQGTPVYAIDDGTVTCWQKYEVINGASKLVSYGNLIEFTSSNGKTTAKYAHLNGFAKCGLRIPSSQTERKSATGLTKSHNLGTYSVRKGECIGYVGITGNSSGAHLHFEIRINGARKNPPDYVKIK